MTNPIQADADMGDDFSGASQQQQTQDYYGDIGLEAAYVHTRAHYITVGRGPGTELPPGATSKPCVISAASIPSGYNCDQ